MEFIRRLLSLLRLENRHCEFRVREGFMGDLARGMLSIYLSPTHQQEKPKLDFVIS